MNFKDVLKTTTTVFLDTAPLIYYVEKNPSYFLLTTEFFEHVDQGRLTIVTSPITLSESLIFPVKQNQTQLIQIFSDLIVRGNHTMFVNINEWIGLRAAELRVQYNLSLTDALQIATALSANCDAFLTNDLQLKRVSEIKILVLQDFLV